MRYLDGALRTLRGAGFPPDLLDLAFHTVENRIVGHALQEPAFPLAPDRAEETGERILRSLPPGDHPDLAAHIRHRLRQGGGDDGGFEFGLHLTLDGLERRRARP
ncbi:TetR/AcrR family transcriptional regulator C-terminal domain-containing protein [Nocardiopsis potens]|uniref:TetR/AcrR family transcriptional regulator C-terminal domain-containing protein n=1 Tax=Nocardiopsis potens TaxID=1246458 RepID=UPI0003460E36|nr:TetR/AcrR family transcriptional regulator C-terminal domain-containing protein [Nocardiopsis potens]